MNPSGNHVVYINVEFVKSQLNSKNSKTTTMASW